MNRDNKYSVILMRDRSPARRFCIRPFWIRLAVLVSLLLLVVSGTGIYLSFTMMGENKKLSNLYESKAESVTVMEKELTRLRNLGKVVESYNQEEVHSMLTRDHREKPLNQEPRAYLDLNEIFRPVDRNIIGISNVQARLTQNMMRVQLDINNMAAGGTISGRVALFLIQNNGEIIDLALEDRELLYTIAHFRTMDVGFSLPQGVDSQSIFALRIDVHDDEDSLIFSQTYPMAGILV